MLVRGVVHVTQASMLELNRRLHRWCAIAAHAGTYDALQHSKALPIQTSKEPGKSRTKWSNENDRASASRKGQLSLLTVQGDVGSRCRAGLSADCLLAVLPTS